jgi:hypothetical protein
VVVLETLVPVRRNDDFVVNVLPELDPHPSFEVVPHVAVALVILRVTLVVRLVRTHITIVVFPVGMAPPGTCSFSYVIVAFITPKTLGVFSYSVE